MTSMPKIICTVRALHSFHSPEQSSLSFEKGDFIDVLAQLDSGWWDGWCNGTRGWFPSNYVEIVSVEEPNMRVPGKKQQDSLSTVDEEHYFYSQLADDVRFRAPANTNSDDEEYDAEFRIRNGSIEDSDEERDQFEPELEPRRPQNMRKDSAKRFSMDSQPSVIPEMDELSDNLDLGADQLMTQWVERKTPQGRLYYCNLVTQETTWDKDAIDPATGRLRRNEASESSTDEQVVSKVANCYGDDASNIITLQSISSGGTNNSEPLNWQKLSADVAVAIHQLNNTAQQNLRSLFTQHTILVVQTIRMMLYAAGLMEKDSHHTQDAVLRGPHRALMASLSKLVLSARMASEAPSACAPSVSTELIFKLQKNAGDVLASVRDFVTACQQRQIRVEHVAPRFVRDNEPPTPDDEADGHECQKIKRPKYPLNQDLVVSLQTHINQIYGSTDALAGACSHALEMQHEENLNGTAQADQSKARANIIALFSTFTGQLSQFFTIIQGIDLDNMDNIQAPSLDAFKAEKQALYDLFGKLLAAVQTHSDQNNPISYTVSLIDDTVTELEQSLGCVFTCVVDMVEQRRQWLLRRGCKENTTEVDDTDTADDNISGANTAQTLSLPPVRLRGHRRQASPMIESSGGKPEQQRQRQPNMKPDENPWYLGHEHQDEDQIAFTSDGTVKAGTLPALVERLTLHDTLDTSFIANFLLTYRSFCTTEEFVALLEKRYTITAPEGLTPEELEIWKERKQKLIRIRVFNVMKNWLESYYNDEDKVILDRLEFFTNTVIRDASPFAADQLNRFISMRKETDAEDGLKKLVPNNDTGPVPIIPRNLTTTRINLLDTDPLELARQLSIVDFKLYSSIRPIECLNKAWSGDDADLAVHVKQSINYCNQLTSWVTGSILEHDEARRRVIVIKHWALVADRCRTLNNFNTCMAILSAFDNSAVGRLRRTWEMVGKGTNQILNHIRKLMGANRNFTEYREMIHSINPPCIPFLGIYLQDLTFIEDGNPDILPKSNNLINFAKRQKTAEVIREIKQFQSVPYKLQVVPLLQHFIKTQLEASLDVETLYERSLEIEPRTTAAAAEAARLLEMIN